MDQALRHSDGPDAGLWIAGLIDGAAADAVDQLLDIGELPALVEDLDCLAGDGVAVHAGGVAEWSEEELGVTLGGGAAGFLAVVVVRCLLPIGRGSWRGKRWRY